MEFCSELPDGDDSTPQSDHLALAAQYAVDQLKTIGHTTYLLECDVEYVRKPVGFPVDTEMDLPSTAAIPALLAAKGLGLDAIAFGVIAESAYKVGCSMICVNACFPAAVAVESGPVSGYQLASGRLQNIYRR